LAGTLYYFTNGDETIKNALVNKYLQETKEQNGTINADNIGYWLENLINTDFDA